VCSVEASVFCYGLERGSDPCLEDYPVLACSYALSKIARYISTYSAAMTDDKLRYLFRARCEVGETGDSKL
jgi:hypothetical protein